MTWVRERQFGCTFQSRSQHFSKPAEPIFGKFVCSLVLAAAVHNCIWSFGFTPSRLFKDWQYFSNMGPTGVLRTWGFSFTPGLVFRELLSGCSLSLRVLSLSLCGRCGRYIYLCYFFQLVLIFKKAIRAYLGDFGWKK